MRQARRDLITPGGSQIPLKYTGMFPLSPDSHLRLHEVCPNISLRLWLISAHHSEERPSERMNLFVA